MKDIAQLKKESVIVYPSYGRETEEVAVIKESLLKEGKATLDVYCFDYGEYFLLGSTKRLEMAMELELPIILVKYDDYDFVDISKYGLKEDDFPPFVAKGGTAFVSSLLEIYHYNHNIYYDFDAYITKGKPIFSINSYVSTSIMRIPITQ